MGTKAEGSRNGYKKTVDARTSEAATPKLSDHFKSVVKSRADEFVPTRHLTSLQW